MVMIMKAITIFYNDALVYIQKIIGWCSLFVIISICLFELIIAVCTLSLHWLHNLVYDVIISLKYCIHTGVTRRRLFRQKTVSLEQSGAKSW